MWHCCSLDLFGGLEIGLGIGGLGGDGSCRCSHTGCFSLQAQLGAESLSFLKIIASKQVEPKSGGFRPNDA